MTDDDGDYGTKKIKLFWGGGEAPQNFFANLGVFLTIFVLDF